MNGKEVQRLEEEIESVLSRYFDSPALRRKGRSPTSRLLHLMAKAAVTVYEASELAEESTDDSEE